MRRAANRIRFPKPANQPPTTRRSAKGSRPRFWLNGRSIPLVNGWKRLGPVGKGFGF
jgi:hypothetical protein